MPTLDWMGKSKVINHHRDVPYRILNCVPEKGVLDSHGSDCGNMVIHGDNLEALKALLPEYEGKVDCIYIDPPYNTGKENWVYNDNVNDPRIKRWLGEVVGKEGEDFTRHDKWLCMMYPRLQLLNKMLSTNGVIFISMDDSEIANLISICDDIFGYGNRIANFVWQKRTSPDARKRVSTAHEYILAYAKRREGIKAAINLLSLSDEDASAYTNPDNDPRGPWTSSDFTAQGYRSNQMYTIVTPAGKSYSPSKGHCWKNTEDEYRRQLAEGRFWFGVDGTAGPRRKTYLYEREGRNIWTWWTNKDVGNTQEATNEITSLFGTKTAFDYPKPSRLIRRIVQLATKSDSIVLDSFAGSGTTAEAVERQNLIDGGRRRFILIEMGDYADSVTAQRARLICKGYTAHSKTRQRLYEKKLTASNLKHASRFYDEALAITERTPSSKYDTVEGPKIEDDIIFVDGITKSSQTVPGIDSGFSYYELGPALFMGDGSLNPNVTLADLKRYVWYTETRAIYVDHSEDSPFLLGEYAQAVYYLVYEKDAETVLSYDLLKELPRRGAPTVIYADRCVIAPERLDSMGIVFKQVPRQIVRL